MKMRLLLILAGLVVASVTAQKRVLVLVDNANIEKTHSVFLASLKTRGYESTVKKADDATLQLIKFGEFLYDHVVIFAPTVEEFGGSLSVEELAKFVDGGGNVLVAGDANLGEALRDFALEIGFEFGSEGTVAVDDQNYDAKLDKGQHNTLVVPTSSLTPAELIVGNKQKLTPILFRGVGLVYNKDNQLRLPILSAPTTTTLSKTGVKSDNETSTDDLPKVLIGGLQARNNARVVISGSLAFFSDEFFKAQVQKAGSTDKPVKSGNAELVDSLTKWVFQEVGVLRVKSVNHHKIGEKSPPRDYTITDDASYEIEIEELKEGKWVPFKGTDVQLEFVRIDPFIRTTLKNNNGKLSTKFKIPDVYGVFKFKVDYHRIGYTHLTNVQQVTVRPFEHTQYERFVQSAYPYYVSSFSMMLGVFLFSCVFLYHKEAPLGTKPTDKPVASTSAASTSKKNK